jgi:hypothetical protein
MLRTASGNRHDGHRHARGHLRSISRHYRPTQGIWHAYRRITRGFSAGGSARGHERAHRIFPSRRPHRGAPPRGTALYRNVKPSEPGAAAGCGNHSLHSRLSTVGCAGKGSANEARETSPMPMSIARPPRLVNTWTAPGTTHRPSSARVSSTKSGPVTCLRIPDPMVAPSFR